jgi:hypothetical protein
VLTAKCHPTSEKALTRIVKEVERRKNKPLTATGIEAGQGAGALQDE